MLKITRVLLYILGGAAIAIGLMIFLMGPNQTAKSFDSLTIGLLGLHAYSSGLEHVNVDSEMRFFSVFWIAYGGIVLWLTARLVSHAKLVFAAMALFFTGGVGRLISLVSVGSPEPLFLALLCIELAGPILLALVFAAGLRTHAQL